MEKKQRQLEKADKVFKIEVVQLPHGVAVMKKMVKNRYGKLSDYGECLIQLGDDEGGKSINICDGVHLNCEP